MIEIIRRGSKEKTTCNNCGCHFSYEPEDVKHCADGIAGIAVQCPQCNKYVYLEQTRSIK